MNIITAHSFRSTTIQWLLDANHPETVIAKRTWHKDKKSLKSYNNLMSLLQRLSVLKRAKMSLRLPMFWTQFYPGFSARELALLI